MSYRAAALSLVTLATISAVPLAAQGHASDFGIAVRAGTLGIGGEISKLLVSHVGVRVGVNYFKLTDKGVDLGGDNGDVKVDLEAKLQAITGLIDLYPSPRGSFHFTGGITSTPAKVSGTGAGSSYTFNSHSYTGAQVGTLTAEVKFPSTMPYVGIGFGTAASDHGGLSFVLDLGVAIGKPALSFSGSNVTAGSTLDNDMKAEAASKQSDLNKIPGYPQLAIGFMFRF